MRPLHLLPSLLLLILLLPACTVYGEHPVKSFSDATGGGGFENAFWQDIKRKDWHDLESHLASNFIYLAPSGPLERADALAALKQMEVKDFSLGELQTQLNGNTFVVTYAITLRGSTAGQPLAEPPQQRMTVWQKQASGWVAIAHAVLGSA